jgi:hypothetical protein
LMLMESCIERCTATEPMVLLLVFGLESPKQCDQIGRIFAYRLTVLLG